MPTKEKVPRGKSYSELEDKELAKAYVIVTTDEQTGINQNAKTFWTRVKDVMETTDTISNAIANGDLETRTFSSLQAHFGQMQKSIGKYVGCMERVELLRESGSTDRDMMKKALKMYKERHGHTFAYLTCYDVLAPCPKFQTSIERSAKKTHGKKRSPSDAQDAGTTSPSTQLSLATPSLQDSRGECRPQGVKAAKRGKLVHSMEYRTVKAQEALSESMAVKVDVLKEQLLVNQAQQRLKEEQALHKMLNELFNITPNSAQHAAYLEKRRGDLLRRLDALIDKRPSLQPTEIESSTQQMLPVAETTSEENEMLIANKSVLAPQPSRPETSLLSTSDDVFPVVMVEGENSQLLSLSQGTSPSPSFHQLAQTKFAGGPTPEF